MSQRVQQHAIEDESFVQFQALLPREWVFRKEEKDYGIDASIEIFGEDRTTTGLRAFVQLKGTDSEKNSVQRKLPFKLKDLEYWQSQSLPVLLIRYCSIGKKIYWAWDFDRRIQVSQNEVYASLTLDDSDLWGEESPSKIQKQLENLKLLYHGQISLPISMQALKVSTSQDLQISREIRKEMRAYLQLVNYGNLSTQLYLSLEEKEDEIILGLQGTATAAIPFEKDSPEKLAANLIAGAAFCFAAVGQLNVAKKLLEKCYQKAEFHCFDDTSFLLSHKLLAAGEFDLVADIAIDAQKRELNSLGIGFYTFTPIYFSSGACEQNSVNSGAAMLHYLEICIKAKDPRAGQISYNCGEFFLSLGALREALRFFRQAATLDKSYQDKDYLFIQAGGTLFRSKRFKASSACYIRAIKIQKRSDPATMALLGESQLKCGKIGSSRFWLGKALERTLLREDPRHASFELHYWTADALREICGESRIKRQTSIAQGHIHKVIHGTETDTEELLNQAIRLDPVSSSVWHAVAIERNTHKVEGAFEAFIKAAVLSDGNIAFWVDLLVSALQQDFEPDKLYIFFAAASVVGFNNLAEEIRERSERPDLANEQILLLEKLGDLFSTFPRVLRPKVLRLVPQVSEEEK